MSNSYIDTLYDEAKVLAKKMAEFDSSISYVQVSDGWHDDESGSFILMNYCIEPYPENVNDSDRAKNNAMAIDKIKSLAAKFKGETILGKPVQFSINVDHYMFWQDGKLDWPLCSAVMPDNGIGVYSKEVA